MQRILIVDDEAGVRKMLTDLLTRHGYQTAEAESGACALSLLPGFDPELVLLDILMPGMDGLEVLRRIQKNPCRTGIIMLTAVVDSATARKAVRWGAWDYLTKPFTPDQVVSMVSMYFLLHAED